MIIYITYTIFDTTYVVSLIKTYYHNIVNDDNKQLTYNALIMCVHVFRGLIHRIICNYIHLYILYNIHTVHNSQEILLGTIAGEHAIKTCAVKTR